jgi:hypothetical protein
VVEVCRKPIVVEKNWQDHNYCYDKDVVEERRCRQVKVLNGYRYDKHSRTVKRKRRVRVPVERKVTDHLFVISGVAHFRAANGTSTTSTIEVSPRAQRAGASLRSRAFEAFVKEVRARKYLDVHEAELVQLQQDVARRMAEGDPVDIAEGYANMWAAGRTIYGEEVGWLAYGLDLPAELVGEARGEDAESPLDLNATSREKTKRDLIKRARRGGRFEARNRVSSGAGNAYRWQKKMRSRNPRRHWNYSWSWRKSSFVEDGPSYDDWPTMAKLRQAELRKLSYTASEWQKERLELIDPPIPTPQPPP